MKQTITAAQTSETMTAASPVSRICCDDRNRQQRDRREKPPHRTTRPHVR